MNKIPNTFLACDSIYKNSDIVLFGAPFDSTTSGRPGTRYASRYMRTESVYGMESYSPFFDKDLSEIKVCDYGDISLPFGNSKKTLNILEKVTDKIFNDNKIPFMIGGEHLLTLATVKAATKKYSDLNIIHFDAHSDTADTILGEKLSHGTVMKRIFELNNNIKIYQFGIRSGTKKEFLWCKENIYTNKFNFNGLENIVNEIKNKPVYLSVDIDVLDPSILPATGTPEAGGVTFLELLNALKTISKLNIIGADLMELSPLLDTNGTSTTIACKLLREMLLII